MPVEWEPDEVERKLRARLSQNMDRAAVYLVGKIKRKINRGNARGTSPSLPGEPPKKVSTRLFQSITYEKTESDTAVVAEVGSNVEYARRLELGFTGTDKRGRTIDQAPRPFLRVTLNEEQPAIARILARR